MNWGAKIILAFVCFFGVIFTLAYISMQQDISLVSDNYYEQELTYEDQIERLKNTQGLSERPKVTVDKQSMEAKLVFPESIRESIDEGTVQFFRPSNAALDKHYTIALDGQGEQAFDLSTFSTGLWKAKISWKWKNREYYEEINLVF